MMSYLLSIFFFNDTATTEIYTLSLHDALPISLIVHKEEQLVLFDGPAKGATENILPQSALLGAGAVVRSEEHTSELQSRRDLVCRLLLEKKKEIQKHE